jgi:hypothetical protein
LLCCCLMTLVQIISCVNGGFYMASETLSYW